ncbi:MAG: TonB-dependent receptor [bacterium]|nr:TonB-dependent receptor [bacterium]
MRKMLFAVIFLFTVNHNLINGDDIIKIKIRKPETVVTASRYISVQPNSLIITREEILTYKDFTVADVLETVPGISIKRFGGKSGIASVSIQGSSSEHTLIMLNGRPLKNGIYGTSDLNNINMESIQAIEVFRGGMSSVFGSDAVGGAINIITNKPENKTSIKLSCGSYNDQNLFIENSFATDLFHYRLNYWNGRYDGFRPVSYFNNNGLSGDLTLYITDNYRFNIFGKNYFSRRGNPGAVNGLLSEQEDQGYTVQTKLYADEILYGRSELYFEKKLDERYKISGSISDSRSLSDTYGFNHNLDLNHHSVLFGGELYKVYTDDTTLLRDMTVKNTAVFINDEFNVLPFWKMNLGVRSDESTSFGRADTFRISSAWNLEDLALKTSYGTSFKAPDISDLYYYYSTKYFTSEGNPDLKPEHGRNFDIELSYHLAESVRIRLSYFKNVISNLIDWQEQENKIWRPENLDEAVLAGVEYDLGCRISENFNFNFNINSLTEANDARTGEWLSYRAKYRAALSLNHVSGTGQFNIRTIYVSERAGKNGGNWDLPSFLRTDINYSTGFMSVFVHNLFDIEYEEILSYPMSGRTIGVMLNFELKY